MIVLHWEFFNFPLYDCFCIKNQSKYITKARSVIVQVQQTDLILDDTHTHNGRQCYQIIALSTSFRGCETITSQKANSLF